MIAGVVFLVVLSAWMGRVLWRGQRNINRLRRLLAQRDARTDAQRHDLHN